MRFWKRFILVAAALALLLSSMPAAFAAHKTYSTAPTASEWKTYPAKLHHFYMQLSTVEKQAFSSQYDALALGKPELWSIWDFDLTYAQRQRVYYAVKYDCPELMFADFQYNTFFDEANLLKHTKVLKTNLPKTLKVLKKIQKRKDYKGGTFNHQLAFDRFVVNKVRYLLDDSTDIYGNRIPYAGRRAAYSVFLNNVAVCEGYARGAQLALRYFGIPCLYAYGRADGGLHAWNLVNIGGAWYHYDATWNDWDKKEVYTDFLPYFNLNGSVMGLSHSLDREATSVYGFSLPTCSATKFEYYRRQGQALGGNWKKKMPALIKNAKKKKKKAIGIRFTSKSYYNAAVKYVRSGKMRFRFGYTYYYIPNALMMYFRWK